MDKSVAVYDTVSETLFSFAALVKHSRRDFWILNHSLCKHWDASHSCFIHVCLCFVYRAMEPCSILWKSTTGKVLDLPTCMCVCNLYSYQTSCRIGVPVFQIQMCGFCLISFSQKHWVQWCNSIFSSTPSPDNHWSGSAGGDQQSALKCLKEFKILYHLRLDFFSFFFWRVERTWLLKLISSCAHFSLSYTPHHISSLLFFLLTCRYVTAVALSPTMPWIATGSMDRTVNVWRIGDGDTGAGEYWVESCFGLAPPNAQSLLFSKQIVSTGAKLRSHLEHQSLPKECFGIYPASSRSSCYMCIAVWLQSLEEELWLMFIGAAGQTITDPQRAVVIEVNPLYKKKKKT